MLSAETRADLVYSLLAPMVEAGLSRDEMTKFSGFVAEVLEGCAERGIDPADLVKMAHDKEAFLQSFGGSLTPAVVGGAAKGVFDKVTGTAAGIGSKLLDAGVRYAPLMAGASVAAPLLVGFGAGGALGRATDHGDEMVRELHQRELVSLLRENARLARHENATKLTREEDLASRRMMRQR